MLAMSKQNRVEPDTSSRMPRWKPSWAVPEVPVPESELHDAAIDYLRSVLLAWAERSRDSFKLLRNIGIRWVKSERRAGFDPDLALIEPAPPADNLRSLRLWLPNHSPPALAVEVVSVGNPYKDYIDTPERAAACGVGELWVYDPLLAGPRARGGPFLLQIWRRGRSGAFQWQHAGAGPVFSEAVGGWLHPVATDRAREARLRISDRPEGAPFWLTARERDRRRAAEAAARATEAAARATEAAARAAQAEARARQLEAELAELRGR